MIAAPVQKTVLTPSGFAAAQDDSASGTFGWVATSREYLQLQREDDLPHRQRDDQRVQPQHPDEDAVDEADERPDAEAGEDREREPVVRPRGTPTSRFAPREITPGVERSMPACMTTSICPSAAIARIVMYGRTNAHDVLPSASGAVIAATTASAPVASQTGRKRAATRPLATSRATVGAHDGPYPARSDGEGLAATRRPF